MNIFYRLLGIFLLLSPFIIGWLIFCLLHPVGFLEVFLTLVFAIVICFYEGFFAWILGLALILES